MRLRVEDRQNLRDRIAAVIDREVDGLWEPLDVADAVIAALDRDYIVVEPGTPLAQKIVEWQWETAND